MWPVESSWICRHTQTKESLYASEARVLDQEIVSFFPSPKIKASSITKRLRHANLCQERTKIGNNRKLVISGLPERCAFATKCKQLKRSRSLSKDTIPNFCPLSPLLLSRRRHGLCVRNSATPIAQCLTNVCAFVGWCSDCGMACNRTRRERHVICVYRLPTATHLKQSILKQTLPYIFVMFESSGSCSIFVSCSSFSQHPPRPQAEVASNNISAGPLCFGSGRKLSDRLRCTSQSLQKRLRSQLGSRLIVLILEHLLRAELELLENLNLSGPL